MEFAGKRYRIKSRARFIIFIALMLMISALWLNGIFGLSDVNGLTYEKYAEVEVVYGDSLWNIARAYMPEGNDIRRYVSLICELNDVSADSLRAGQILLIPV